MDDTTPSDETQHTGVKAAPNDPIPVFQELPEEMDFSGWRRGKVYLTRALLPVGGGLTHESYQLLGVYATPEQAQDMHAHVPGNPHDAEEVPRILALPAMISATHFIPVGYWFFHAFLSLVVDHRSTLGMNDVQRFMFRLGDMPQGIDGEVYEMGMV